MPLGISRLTGQPTRVLLVFRINYGADYDRATDMERLGGVVLELPKSDWSVISEAA